MFEHVVKSRRAFSRFRNDPVPELIIVSALTLAGQAPLGYNFQSRRFLVLRDSERRTILRKMADNLKQISAKTG